MIRKGKQRYGLAVEMRYIKLESVAVRAFDVDVKFKKKSSTAD